MPELIEEVSETVAVNVTDWPKIDGLDGESVIEVVALLTIWLKAGSVLLPTPLPLKFASPLYTAVIECVAASRTDVVIEAWPLLSATGEPIAAVPSMNVTAPVGVPVLLGEMSDTFAVNVTGCP
jgi:hypothetical protein